MGFPFGFVKIRAILIPKRLGLAGELGVFALDAILAGLIGGVFLIKKLVIILFFQNTFSRIFNENVILFFVQNLLKNN